MISLTEKQLNFISEGGLVGVEIEAILSSGQTLTIPGDDILQGSFRLDTNAMTGRDFAIGEAQAAELSFSIYNEGGKYDGIKFEGAKLVVWLDIDRDIELDEPLVQLGVYTVDERPNRGQIIVIKALDNLAKFAKTFEPTKYNGSWQSKTLVRDFCNYLGITLNLASFPDSHSVVINDVSIFEGSTYLATIGWIAGSFGANVTANSLGHLKFVTYVDTGQTFPERVILTDERVESPIKVTGVIYHRDSYKVYDEDLEEQVEIPAIDEIVGTDTYALDMSTNPIFDEISDSDRATQLNLIYTTYKDLSFLPRSEFSIISLPHIQPMDIFHLSDGTSVLATKIIHNLNNNTKISTVGTAYMQKGYATGLMSDADRIAYSSVAKEIADDLEKRTKDEWLQHYSKIDAAIEQGELDTAAALARADEAVLAIDTAVENAGFLSLDATISSLGSRISGIQTTLGDSNSGLISQVGQTASSISSVVADLTSTTGTSSYSRISSIQQNVSGIQSTVSSLDSTVGTHTTQISQVATGLTSKVSTTEFNSQITQLSNNINLRVSKNDVVNQINISNESILISGSKIQITGSTYIENGVIKSAMIGTLDASKITSGTISADRISVTNLSAISANIAGWTIGAHLTAGSGSNFVALYGGTASSYLRAGAEDVSSAPFRVTKAGALTATSATIRGTLSAGSIVNSSTVNANSSSYLYGYYPSGWLGGVAISNYGVGEMLLSGALRVGGINQTTGGTGGLNTFTGKIEAYNDLTVYGTFSNPSDIHYKQNIIAPDKKSLINNIYSLSIKEFEMRATPERKRLGVIANSVIVDQPDLASYVVAPNDEGYLEVDYQTISNMSILAIQDLNERVKRIEEKLA